MIVSHCLDIDNCHFVARNQYNDDYYLNKTSRSLGHFFDKEDAPYSTLTYIKYVLVINEKEHTFISHFFNYNETYLRLLIVMQQRIILVYNDRNPSLYEFRELDSDVSPYQMV
jgi:hypothetical protein